MLFFRYVYSRIAELRNISSILNSHLIHVKPISLPLSLTLSSHSFFKTLVDTEVTVELKNDISIRGTLKSVDQYLNIKLDDISVLEEIKYPHLVSEPPGTLSCCMAQDRRKDLEKTDKFMKRREHY